VFMVVVLHNIRSMHNVGSIFRTADAVGCEKIYLCGITPSPLDRFGRSNGKLLKVSLGAEKYVDWRHYSSVARAIDELKAGGYAIFAVEQNKKSTSLYRLKPIRSQNMKYALILGDEVRGLSAAILKKADKIIEIPMRGKKESLNVAVAFGIVAFYLLK